MTGNGYGKRTPMGDYPRKGRPTKGVRTIKVSDKKGELITARPVREGQQLLLISIMGQVIRIRVDDVRSMGRSTEGVRVMNMADDDLVCGVASVVEPSEEITEEATVGGLDEPEDGLLRRGAGAADAASTPTTGRRPTTRTAPAG